jgi:EAL domain-containing protein (putative c-di-GMP-specific phosphodiesterase class I)
MEEACREHLTLASEGFDSIRVAVNVSMPQFRDPRFIEQVAERIARSGIPPQFLELEITESIAMDDPAEVRERLSSVRDLGVCIAIDDFGTGYSSLGQLQSLPIDYLKIDRSFVIDITNERAGNFAGTIVDFCRKLGMHSIAEGVETPEQADVLRRLGCDIAQGYLYGKPMKPDVLHGWFAAAAGRRTEAADAAR